MSVTSDSSLTVVRLWSASTAITRKIDLALGAIHGIGFNEYVVLSHLIAAPNKTLRRIDLAESIGRTASGVTRMLLPMEKIGLVRKESNPRDARVSLVQITASGEEIYGYATNTLDEKSASLLGRLEKKEVKRLLKLACRESVKCVKMAAPPIYCKPRTVESLSCHA